MSFCARRLSSGEVIHEGPVDRVGEPPFHATQGADLVLALGEVAAVVGDAGGISALWLIAAWCSALLSLRFPARESR